MAFTGRTPESLIPRSDSRNPATTCKGITKSGRPCRRPIDAKASQDDGVLAVVSVVSDEDEEEIGAAAYFCWQHKDQAEQLAAQVSSGPATHLYPLKERNSIDTLVERLGVLQVNEPPSSQEPRRKTRNSTHDNQTWSDSRKNQFFATAGPMPPRSINRPPTWDNVQGPLISIPSDVMAAEKRRTRRPLKPVPQRQKQSFWASLCCGSADEEPVEEVIIRHKRRTTSQTPQQPAPTPMQQVPQPAGPLHQSRPRSQSRRSSAHRLSTSAMVYQDASPTRLTAHQQQQQQQPLTTSNVPARKPLAPKSIRPLNKAASQTDSNSPTAQILRFIPATLSAQLTSTLLAEASKPISSHDEEGYIYIFWLTPDASGPAPTSAASSLLGVPGSQSHGRAPPWGQEAQGQGQGQGQGRRRNSHVLRQYSVKKETIFLKIGRANNVHRRMNEWTRQCGFNLSLVRYYPYVSSSSTSTPWPPWAQTSTSTASKNEGRVSSGNVRKVPHAHRVERLIHLELGAQRVIKSCEACGKTHKEWFEVEASREGVKNVDDVVRRWVEWAERTANH
ncbi:hypothetical protein ACEQ8H_007997 [Pleosporales sp. CAS-2024a]